MIERMKILRIILIIRRTPHPKADVTGCVSSIDPLTSKIFTPPPQEMNPNGISCHFESFLEGERFWGEEGQYC